MSELGHVRAGQGLGHVITGSYQESVSELGHVREGQGRAWVMS